MYAFLLMSLISFSSFAANFELAGKWTRSQHTSDEAPLLIVQIKDGYYIQSQEKFVFENGQLSHTIDQTVKLSKNADGSVKGTVDFFDSRGCSYPNLDVVGEFQNEDTVNFLMTVPRYQFVTITNRDASRTRPRYCQLPSPYYPYYTIYICGYDPVITGSRNECNLLEYVQVPVQLNRVP